LLVSLEGALGKIALNSTKNPKQAIKITGISDVPNAKGMSKKMAAASTIVSQKKVLKTIEQVYTCVLNLEHLKRKVTGIAKDPNFDESRDDFDVEARNAAWHVSLRNFRMAEGTENVEKMVRLLEFTQDLPVDVPHPLTHFLHYAKGKKIISRALKNLNPALQIAFVKTLCKRLEGLDACHVPIGQKTNGGVELFMQSVIPVFVQVINELDLENVNQLTRILFERHPCLWLVKSKVGLAILAMLLSRAEIVKSSSGQGEQILENWQALSLTP